MQALGPWVVAIGLVALSILLYALFLYNALLRVKNNVDRAWGNVDVLLKQRADEVPNLVATVRGYAAHERELFESVARARATTVAKVPLDEKAAANDALRDGVARIFAVAEEYPALRASDSFLALQRRLSALEDQIADRREFYNDSVAVLNTRIQEFPDVLVARRMTIGPREYFRAEGADRAVPSTA